MINIKKLLLLSAALAFVVCGCTKPEAPAPTEKVATEPVKLKPAPLYEYTEKSFNPSPVSEALLKAIVFGDEAEIVKDIEAGADINYTGSDGSTPLMLALINHKRTILDNILSLGADINIPTNTGKTPLMIAVMNCDQDFAGKLIARGANVNAYDSNGSNAAAYTASCTEGNAVEIFNSLLNAESDIYYTDKNGFSLYDLAYIKRNEPLLARFKNLDIPSAADQKILDAERFVADADQGDLDLIHPYVQQGGDIDYVSKISGLTALLNAALNSKVEAVEFLLFAGANQTVQTPRGLTLPDIMKALNITYNDPNNKPDFVPPPPVSNEAEQLAPRQPVSNPDEQLAPRQPMPEVQEMQTMPEAENQQNF